MNAETEEKEMSEIDKPNRIQLAIFDRLSFEIKT